MATAAADDRTRALLDFEREWAVRDAGAGDKGAAITERFGISAQRYYQVLGRILDDPAAMAYDPLTVRRLRRRRDERRNQRTARALGERTSR
jgi:hypothetical protein